MFINIIMYHKVGIDSLTNAQIAKLLSGGSVRVRHGSKHTIALSAEQHKKHVKAADKGKAHTITLDPYQQDMHKSLRGTGIMSTLKKAAGHVKNAYHQAKSALGHASKFYGENKEVLEPYGNILKKQASHKVEHYAERAQPHLSKHLGEFGTHLGQHARESALHSIHSFGEDVATGQETPIELSESLEGSGMRRRGRPPKGGKINFNKVLSKVGNTALKGVSDYAKSKQGQALIQHGIKLGTDAALMSAGMPPMAGMGVHKRKGRPRKVIRGSALYAAGYNS